MLRAFQWSRYGRCSLPLDSVSERRARMETWDRVVCGWQTWPIERRVHRRRSATQPASLNEVRATLLRVADRLSSL